MSQIRASNLDYKSEIYNHQGLPLMIPWTHQDYLDLKNQTDYRHGCPLGAASRISSLDPSTPQGDQLIVDTWMTIAGKVPDDKEFNTRLRDTWHEIGCGANTAYPIESMTLLMSRSPAWYCPEDFCSTLAKSFQDETTCPIAHLLLPAYRAELHRIEIGQHGAEYRINVEIRKKALAAIAQGKISAGPEQEK